MIMLKALQTVIIHPSGEISFESRSETAERLRKIADKLESDPAVDVFCRFDIDTSGTWEIHTEYKEEN